jgi:hypothetical protein
MSGSSSSAGVDEARVKSIDPAGLSDGGGDVGGVGVRFWDDPICGV